MRRGSCRTSTATQDEGALFADITLTPPGLLLERAGLRRKEATLLHGGPPCVAFSKTGYWLPYKREDRDEKATLVDWYAGMVAETKPMAVLMENVYGLVYKRSRHHLHRFLAAMDEAGYEMRYSVLLAADYGVPQIRQRLFCVGIRRDLFSSDPAWWQFPWPEQSHAGPHETRKLWRTESLRTGQPARPSKTCEMRTILRSPRRSSAAHTRRSCARSRRGTTISSGPPSAVIRSPRWEWRSRYWSFLLKASPDRAVTDDPGAAGAVGRAVSLGQPALPYRRAEAAHDVPGRLRGARQPSRKAAPAGQRCAAASRPSGRRRCAQRACGSSARSAPEEPDLQLAA